MQFARSRINPISFAAPQSHRRASIRQLNSQSPLMAAMLERSPQPDFSSVSPPLEGVAKMSRSGMHGYQAPKAIDGAEAKKRRDDAIAALGRAEPALDLAHLFAHIIDQKVRDGTPAASYGTAVARLERELAQMAHNSAPLALQSQWIS